MGWDSRSFTECHISADLSVKWNTGYRTGVLFWLLCEPHINDPPTSWTENGHFQSNSKLSRQAVTLKTRFCHTEYKSVVCMCVALWIRGSSMDLLGWMSSGGLEAQVLCPVPSHPLPVCAIPPAFVYVQPCGWHTPLLWVYFPTPELNGPPVKSQTLLKLADMKKWTGSRETVT